MCNGKNQRGGYSGMPGLYSVAAAVLTATFFFILQEDHQMAR